MSASVVILFFFASNYYYIFSVKAVGDGNIRLLEDEIASALRACSESSETTRHKRTANFRNSTKIDGRNSRDDKMYDHVRRSTNDTRDKIQILNATDYDYEGYGTGRGGENFVVNAPSTVYNNQSTIYNRTKRLGPLSYSKSDSNKCLSQCVFANMQVVDSRGIPRENDLWMLIQSSVTSQQSRAILRNQLRACFQELRSEADDDDCFYSEKLERCLMLRISDRKTDIQN